MLVALLQTPHRFRTKRQLWAYNGFAVETHDSGEYRYVRGKLERNRERITVRGLSDNHNHDLKNLFKGAAISASTRPGPLRDFYVALPKKGMRPTMARLNLARKMAAITLTIRKKGVIFDPQQLHRQAALTQRNSKFTFTMARMPATAGIDPFALLIDRIPDDNLKDVTLDSNQGGGLDVAKSADA